VPAVLPGPADADRGAWGEDRRPGADRQSQGSRQRPDHELAGGGPLVRRPGGGRRLRHRDQLRRGQRAGGVCRRCARARHRDLGGRAVQARRPAAQGRAGQACARHRQDHGRVPAVRHHLRVRRAGGGHRPADGRRAVARGPGRRDDHRHRGSRAAGHRRGRHHRRLRAVADPHRAAAGLREERRLTRSAPLTRSVPRRRSCPSRPAGPGRPGRTWRRPP
jgi:hypothetical protein